jgi:two-component system, LuxR family, response regulator FixJ
MDSQSENAPIVYVVDDDDAVRDSLLGLLQVKGFRAHGFPSADAFLAGIESNCAGCVLLDIRMPGKSGLELQAELVRREIRIPIVIITGHGDVSAARTAFQAGAVDFLEKPLEEMTLLSAISVALDRDRQRRESDAAAAGLTARVARLTAREREVMALVCDGHQNREIAAALGLSIRTVEVHKSHVMEKLQVGSLAELIRLTRSAPPRARA